jgi:predicted nucleic acid-binding protein
MPAIVDTGPLVAFLDRAERHHPWVAERVEELTEATYLLAPYTRAQDALFDLLQSGALSIGFRLEEHFDAVRRLLQKYRDTPMSLADACVVRMAEIHERHAVLTLDSDFVVYRKHGRTPLALIQPAVTC